MNVKSIFCMVVAVVVSVSCSDNKQSTNASSDGVSLEAQRVISVSKLLEGAARQPEMAVALAEQHKKFTKFDGHYLSDTSEEIVEARIIALGKLFEGVARQPEIKEVLQKLYSDYAGKLTPQMISGNPMLQYSRMIILGKLLEGAARQPEMVPMLTTLAESYLGLYADFKNEDMSHPLIQAGRIQLIGRYIEGAARQPELVSMLDSLVEKVAGDNDLILKANSCLANAARLYVMARLSEASARQPGMFLGAGAQYKNILIDQIGVVDYSGKNGGCELPYKAAFYN